MSAQKTQKCLNIFFGNTLTLQNLTHFLIIFQTKFEFFYITPLGRILNRFSSDTYTIDDSLPFILNILLAQLAGLIGSLCISLYAIPWIALMIVPLCPIYLSIQNRYRHSSRDIKRLSSNALSPLYAHFTETIQGKQIKFNAKIKSLFNRKFLQKVYKLFVLWLLQSDLDEIL